MQVKLWQNIISSLCTVRMMLLLYPHSPLLSFWVREGELQAFIRRKSFTSDCLYLRNLIIYNKRRCRENLISDNKDIYLHVKVYVLKEFFFMHIDTHKIKTEVCTQISLIYARVYFRVWIHLNRKCDERMYICNNCNVLFMILCLLGSFFFPSLFLKLQIFYEWNLKIFRFFSFSLQGSLLLNFS